MFGSTWGANQQNQQQQQQQPQQPSAFGQPSGFGTAGFGSTTAGAFGQTQQPQANPMFGNAGAGTAAGTSTGAGFGFGGGSTTTTPSMFGAPKPTTGFGAFGGGNTTFGGSSTFNQPASNTAGTSTGLFGQPSTSSSAFGTGGTGAFGAKPATGFGSTGETPAFLLSPTLQLGRLYPAAAAPAAPLNGTTNPPYGITTERDQNTNLQYQSITCMPAYSGYSFEELRLQDYIQGRRTAASASFGQPAAFGTTQSTAPATTGMFGAQTQPSQNPSVFGAGANTATNPAFGAFGQPAQPTTTTTPATTGLFGGNTGAFGTQNQTQPATTFGAFSQTQPQQNAGGTFGGTAFGSTAPKPGFGTFGGGTSTFGGTGTFGQTQQPQQQPQQSNMFGQAPQPAGSNTFGFGANNGNKSIFGTTPTTQPTQAFSAFGTQPQQQQQQPQQQPSLFGGGGGLFGGTAQQPQQPGTQPQTSIFGAPLAPAGTTNATGAAGTGGGIFGSGNLFNNTQQQQQAQNQPQQLTNTFSSFGKPATTGPTQSLFASGFGNTQPTTNTTQPTGLFGNTLGQSTAQPSPFGNSLFGKPAAPLGGSTTGFGGSTNFGNFTASANAPGAQGTLTASISQPIGENISINSLLSGPRIISLEQPKKSVGLFTDMPTRAPVPRVQLGYTPAPSKLRGFAPPPGSLAKSSSPFSFTSGKPNALTIKVDQPPSLTDSLLGRSASPSLGSGARQSVKKLILDKKVDPADLFIKTGGTTGSLLGTGRVTFSPALSVAAREKDATEPSSSEVPRQIEAASTASKGKSTQSSSGKFTAQSAHGVGGSDDTGSGALEEGDYWVKPDLQTLKRAGYDQLSSFNGLIVGREGYGEIHFLEPVDLTGLPKLGALLGEVVRFEDKECSVYPDSEDVDKPPPGSGLNVKARLSLLHCWAVDKATREPIKEPTHPTAVKHLKRLKNMKGTRFESFDLAEGKWTFLVDHF
ncbi:hypothetical protein BDN72DRAFT_957646 [Pluteus cervinus]|uniref:Uncharacterized protein n=1 Tax=Pluteus cervinus TaxID=181527 RepID=A0ACD3B1B2_9AGAR|nr:hypothetical protein BDN72DRAFT_957646 [Pluteus cervinus]